MRKIADHHIYAVSALDRPTSVGECHPMGLEEEFIVLEGH
jgi:hypothetical protein